MITLEPEGLRQVKMSEEPKPKCVRCGKEIEGIEPLEIPCHLKCMRKSIEEINEHGRNEEERGSQPATELDGRIVQNIEKVSSPA